MRTPRTGARGALSTLGLCSALALAAAPEKLAMNLDTGLWEVTSRGDAGGAPPIPPAMLQRLSAEQQAKMQELMSKPRKFKQCMSADKLSKGFGNDEESGGSCKMNVTTNSSSEFQAEKQCTTAHGTSYDARIHFTLANRHQASGTVDITLTQQDGQVTTMHRTMDAQWLAADCGNIDFEMEK